MKKTIMALMAAGVVFTTTGIAFADGAGCFISSGNVAVSFATNSGPCYQPCAPVYRPVPPRHYRPFWGRWHQPRPAYYAAPVYVQTVSVRPAPYYVNGRQNGSWRR